MLQPRFLLLTVLFLSVLIPGQAWSNVTGRYAGGNGNQFAVQLNIGSPPPAAFIVMLSLPRGVKLVQASPAPSGRSGEQLKWLFKHPRPGAASIAVRLSQPVPVNQLRGEVRYQHPQNGKMFSNPIR